MVAPVMGAEDTPNASPSMQLMQLLWPAGVAVQAIHVAARLGLADLLDAGLSTYARLAPVVINGSLTTVVSGRRGLTLVAFNEHRHLPGDLLTYR